MVDSVTPAANDSSSTPEAVDVAALRKLAEAAAPTPWEVDPRHAQEDRFDRGHSILIQKRDYHRHIDYPVLYITATGFGAGAENLALMLAACNALPAMLTTVERLEAALVIAENRLSDAAVAIGELRDPTGAIEDPAEFADAVAQSLAQYFDTTHRLLTPEASNGE